VFILKQSCGSHNFKIWIYNNRIWLFFQGLKVVQKQRGICKFLEDKNIFESFLPDLSLKFHVFSLVLNDREKALAANLLIQVAVEIFASADFLL